jgi:hypothetical protein
VLGLAFELCLGMGSLVREVSCRFFKSLNVWVSLTRLGDAIAFIDDISVVVSGVNAWLGS